MVQPADSGTATAAPLSMTQLAAVVSRYFPPEARATAVAIAWHESRGNPAALNDKNNTPAGSRDRGLWQINSHWNPSVTDQCAFDPECSTAYAAKLYAENGWKPWATFKRGAYRPFLEQAEAAVEQADKGAGGTPGTHGFIPDWVPTPTPGEIFDDAKGAAGLVIPDSVADAFGYIAKAMARLVSPDFWKRVGIAYAGIGLIVVAIVIVKRDTIAGAVVGSAAGPGGAAQGAAQGEAKGKKKAAAKKEATVTKAAAKDEAKATTDAGADAAAGRPAEGVQAGDASRAPTAKEVSRERFNVAGKQMTGEK